MTLSEIPFESWFTRRYMGQDLCFLCGIELDDKNYTKEHVLPKWILRKYNLFNQTINSLNKTKIKYNHSVIPCCKNCNSNHLSKLENEIKNDVEKGYLHFLENAPKIRIYKWCQLIFYKWLFLETFYSKDRKDLQSESIVTKNQYDNLSLNHIFLRSIDKEIKFDNFFPGSIFICNLKTSSNKTLNFDYFDSVPEQCMAIRLNDIGIIALLADSELHKSLYSGMHTDILKNQLAPIQFKNFFAKCLYMQSLFNDPFMFRFMNISTDSMTIVREVNSQIENSPDFNVYGEWNNEDYLQTLGSVLHVDPESLRLPNGNAGNLFYDMNGVWKEREFQDDGYGNI